jgi:hypothetical protein
VKAPPILSGNTVDPIFVNREKTASNVFVFVSLFSQHMIILSASINNIWFSEWLVDNMTASIKNSNSERDSIVPCVVKSSF